jgi:hypothetical protein
MARRRGGAGSDSAGKTAYPSAVFPIFAVLRHTRVFLTNIIDEPLFNRFIDVFFESYDGGPLWQASSTDESIFAVLVLVLLGRRFRPGVKWDAQ